MQNTIAKLCQFPLQVEYASRAHRIQGSTVKAGSKVNIHWSKAFSEKRNAGMAYVCLGRNERMKDIVISGDLDFAGIHCSQAALDETHRLQQVFDENLTKQEIKKELFWKISYENVRSLQCHKNEVIQDN